MATQLETTLTIHLNSPEHTGLSKPLNFLAFYTHFEEWAGKPTITLVLEVSSFFDLCAYAGEQYGYRSAAAYARNLNAAFHLNTDRSMRVYTDDSSDYVYLCKFTPVSYVDQFTTSEAAGDKLNTMVAAANARGLTTGMRNRSYSRNVANQGVHAQMRNVVATALANAVVHYSLRVPKYEAYLNALEGDYMAGVNGAFTSDIANSIREQRGSIYLDMPRMF